MNRKYLENKSDAGEILSADEKRVRALLGDLERVGAPADFDFRLKARIARAKPQREPRVSGSFAALRYILPLGLVLMVSAFVIFNGVYFADRQDVPQIGENQSQTPPPLKSVETSSSETAEPFSSAPKNTEIASVSASSEARGKNRRPAAGSPVAAEFSNKTEPKNPAGKDADKNIISSRDSALTVIKPVAPPGLDSSRAVQTLPNLSGGKSIGAREVLLQIGIETGLKNDGWKIKRVVPNSLAERSGVRAGDSVEAIDGEKLTDKPLGRKTIEGKNLTVLRGAQKIEISLAGKAN